MKALTLTLFIKLGTAVLGATLKLVTPILRESLEKFLADKYLEALETDNPWDDHFYALMLEVLNIPKPI